MRGAAPALKQEKQHQSASPVVRHARVIFGGLRRRRYGTPYRSTHEEDGQRKRRRPSEVEGVWWWTITLEEDFTEAGPLAHHGVYPALGVGVTVAGVAEDL